MEPQVAVKINSVWNHHLGIDVYIMFGLPATQDSSQKRRVIRIPDPKNV